MIKWGADINSQARPDNDSILHKLVYQDNANENVEWFLKIPGAREKIDFNSLSLKCETPLVHCIRANKIDAIKTLLIQGANPALKHLGQEIEMDEAIKELYKDAIA